MDPRSGGTGGRAQSKRPGRKTGNCTPGLDRSTWRRACQVGDVPVFLAALSTGYNINVATTTLDSANARTFSSFTRGGGMGLPEMTGSPNLTIVPDPASFRVLPWAPALGGSCAMIFQQRRAVSFFAAPSAAPATATPGTNGHGLCVGLEVEWYLMRVTEEHLGDEHIGGPGVRGRPLKCVAPEPGFSYHSRIQHGFDAARFEARLARLTKESDCRCVSIENEWARGRWSARSRRVRRSLRPTICSLFRTATRQICRRNGARRNLHVPPGLERCYSSGWHLHQSVIKNQQYQLGGRQPLHAVER